MGVRATRQLEARRRATSRRLELIVRDAQRSSPQAAETLNRIDSATRAGRTAAKARVDAQRRLINALRGLASASLSVRETAEHLGVT